MASKYWVGGSGTWDTSTTTHWSDTDGGAGGAAVPTAANDVVVNGNSGSPTITIDTASIPVCRSLDTTGSTCVFAWQNSASSHIKIGDASGGALIFSATTSHTNLSSNTDGIQFVSTSNNGGTGWGVTTNGITCPTITFNGVGGKWVLQDNLTTTTNGTGLITLTNGTFDTNGKTITGWGFNATTATTSRTLTLGASVLSFSSTSTTAWNVASTLTLNANTSTITLTGVGATFTGSLLTYNTVTFTASGTQTLTGSAGLTIANVTRTGTAAKTDIFSIGTALTITGTLTLGGGSTQGVNRLLVQSNTVGTARTLTLTAGAVVINGDVDFQDITISGSPSWTNAGSAYVGDCGGNTGLTITVAAAQTYSGTSGANWSANAWTSRVPLPQDNVAIASAFSASQSITADMPRLGANIDWTGTTGAPAWRRGAGISPTLYGSLTLVSNVTSTGASAGVFILAGRSTHTLTNAGVALAAEFGLTFQGPGSTYTLQDALNTAGNLTVSDGTWTTGNNSVTCLTFAATSGRTVTLNRGTSTVTITSAAATTVYNSDANATTDNGSTSTVVISVASTNTRIVRWSGPPSTFGTLTYTVANSPGALQIHNAAQARTLTTLNVSSGRTVTPFAGATITVTNFNVNGVNNGYLYLPGVSGAYASAPDSAALSITSNITVLTRVALNDWTPSSTNMFAAKQGANASDVSWRFYIQSGSTGLPVFGVSSNGTAITDAVSSVAPTITDGATLWMLASWRASDGRVQFFTASGSITSPVASDFTQLGIDKTANVGSLFDSVAALEVGTDAGGTLNFATGNFYRTQVYNGVFSTAAYGGTLQFDADFTAKAFGVNSFTESSANAATVTINGVLAQAGDGRVALTSSTGGTAATLSKATGIVNNVDYLTIQDSTATGGATWYAGANSVNVSNNTGWIFAAAPPIGAISGIFNPSTSFKNIELVSAY